MLAHNGLARRYNKSAQMSFKEMGQTVKQCFDCSTDMEAWISYIVLDVIHEDQSAETGST